jgi:hypothetical protein
MKSNERSGRPKFTDTHPLLTIKVASTQNFKPDKTMHKQKKMFTENCMS